MARKPDLARRKEIITRTLEILRERGVHGTTMSDLAHGLGMKRPTLYWYFKDLGEIFDAALEEIHGRFERLFAERLAGVSHPIDVLETLLQVSSDFHKDSRDLIILLFQLWAVGRSGDPERILKRGREVIEPLRAELITMLQSGVEAKLVAPCDPEAIVDLVLSVGDGIVVQQVTRNADLTAGVMTLRRCVLDPLRLTSETESR
ncbi:TetR/AcrR family transcriptional regulator [Planctomycetota bacterium]